METNPFHNGHMYFLEQALKITQGEPLICVISTNIVQRGEFSVLNKKIKTELLLQNGVDIVCELPAAKANQGGYFFAKSAIKILAEFGVNNLIFGSECADLNQLQVVSNEFEYESFNTGVYSKLNLLSNDILGVNYIKAANDLNLNMNFNLVKRVSNNYNDLEITSYEINSATSIRLNLTKPNTIKNSLPAYSLENINVIDNNVLYTLFKLNLQNCIANNINIFLAEDNQLLYRMQTILNEKKPQTLEELLECCKDKNNSKYKYSRILLNVVLQVEAHDYTNDCYVRILGFKDNYSKFIPEKSFTSLAKNNTKTCQVEKRASYLYSILCANSNITFDEYNNKPIIYSNKL